MSDRCRYGFGADVACDFAATTERLEGLLKERGFRITTRLRMDDVLDTDISESFGRYVILGTCNPEYATALFRADPDIGLMMPCSLVVYELKTGGCRVMVKDPARVMDLIDNPLAIEASMKIKEQLEDVIEKLTEGCSLAGR